MEIILITSTVLILGIMIIRYIFGRKVSAGLIYALWILVVLRLIIPINFGDSKFSILNVTDKITEIVKNEFIYKNNISDKNLSDNNAEKNNLDNDYLSGNNITDVNKYDYAQNEKSNKNNTENDKNKNGTAGNKNISDNELQNKEKQNKNIQNENVQNKNAENNNINDKNIYRTDRENNYIKWIVSAVWIIGVFTMFLVIIISNLKFVLLLKKERVLYSWVGSCEIPIYTVKSISVPCLYGFIRPAIYLNEDIFEKECDIDYVILHEMVHYKHRDYIWSVIRAALLCIYWFDIFVWIGAAYSKKDCEYACDEKVVKMLGASAGIEYGRTIVNLVPKIKSKKEMLFLAASFSENKSNLKERILRIAEMKSKKKVILTTAAVFLLIFIIGVSVFSYAEYDKTIDAKSADNGTDNKNKEMILTNEESNEVDKITDADFAEKNSYKYINDNNIPEPIDLRYDNEVQTYYYYIKETDAGSVVRSINSMIKEKYKTSDLLYDYYSRYYFGGIKDNKPLIKEFDIHLMDADSLEYYYVNALLESDSRVRILIGRSLDYNGKEYDEGTNVYEKFSSNIKLSKTENYIYNNPAYHMTFAEITEFFTQVSALDENEVSKFKDSFMETAAIKMISEKRFNVSGNNALTFELEDYAYNTKIYGKNIDEMIGNFGIVFYLQNRYQGKVILSGCITNKRIVKKISELEEMLKKQEQYYKSLEQKTSVSDIDFIFGDVTAVCGDIYAKQKYSDKEATKRLVKSLSVKDFHEAGTGDDYIADGIMDSIIYKIAQIKSLGITFYHVTDMDLNMLYGVPFKYGNAFVIEQNGVYQVFPTDWTGGYPSHDVNVRAADFDRDGEDEIAMSIVLDHGSECCLESLSVFDMHNGSNYTMHILDETWFVKSVYSDVLFYYEDMLGYRLDIGKMGYESFIYRDGKEDEIRIGNMINYNMKKNGIITVNMPAVNSNTGEWRYYKADVTYFEDGSFIFYNGRIDKEE